MLWCLSLTLDSAQRLMKRSGTSLSSSILQIITSSKLFCQPQKIALKMVYFTLGAHQVSFWSSTWYLSGPVYDLPLLRQKLLIKEEKHSNFLSTLRCPFLCIWQETGWQPALSPFNCIQIVSYVWFNFLRILPSFPLMASKEVIQRCTLDEPDGRFNFN